ncbi:MAG: flagellar hook-associated protein FlgK [Pseudomonadota bacterium]
MGTTGDVFRTALSGLSSFQRAIHTTSNNVANAATEGYTRQRTELVSNVPVNVAGFSLSQGVRVASVSRVHDEFIDRQILNYTSRFNHAETILDRTSRLDEIMANEHSNLSISIQNFFDSMQDTSTNAISSPVRQVLLDDAKMFVEQFHTLTKHLDDTRFLVNNEIKALTVEVNELAGAIAEVNNAIIAAGGINDATRLPNDLLDQRDQLVRELSELVNVNTFETNDGAINVFIGNGQNLVLGVRASTIATRQNAYDATDAEIVFRTSTGEALVTSMITGGKLGGLVEFRSDLTNAQNSLGRIATGFAYSFNAQHRQGMDLDGNVNVDAFSEPVPQTAANANNTGGASLTAAVTDISKLTTSDYTLSYDGANYTLLDLKTKAATTIPGAAAFPYDTGLGFSVTLTGTMNAGDSFMIQPTRRGAHLVDLALTDGRQFALAAPVRVETDINLNSALSASMTVADVSDPNLLVPVDIRITSDAPPQYGVYDVSGGLPGTLLAPIAAYPPAGPITFNGWEVTLTGTPVVAGDTISIRSNEDARSNNENALKLIDLQTTDLMDNGTASYQDLYSGLVSNIGVRAREADTSRDAQEGLLNHVMAKRESVSGVNLDEEAANMLKFQQMYQASSRLITTANLMFETLLNAVR